MLPELKIKILLCCRNGNCSGVDWEIGKRQSTRLPTARLPRQLSCSPRRPGTIFVILC